MLILRYLMWLTSLILRKIWFFLEKKMVNDGLWYHRYAIWSSSKILGDVWIYIMLVLITFVTLENFCMLSQYQTVKFWWKRINPVSLRLLRPLTQVKFIREMKRNLIPQGMLDSKGLEWSSKREWLRWKHMISLFLEFISTLIYIC